MPVRQRRLRLLWIALFLLVLGCSMPGAKKEQKQGPARPPSRGLANIARTGELRIGMSGEQPPLTMTAKNGDLIGLDVALSRVLANSMGVDAKFVKLPFGRLLDALVADQVDMVMSGVTITPARSERVTFVGPYYTSGKSLLTKSESLAGVRIPQDLDSSQIRLSALAGSTSESFVRDSIPRAKLVATEHLEEAIQKVLDGNVDALIADRETCSFAVLRHPDQGLLNPDVVFTIEPMGIAIAPGDPRFANLIQTYLSALEEHGILEKARAFWFKDPAWVKDLR